MFLVHDYSLDSAAARAALGDEAEIQVARAIVMMRRAKALVIADRVQAIGVLIARQVVLARHLQQYQRFKHGSIFDPAIQRGSTSSRIVARTMKIDCVQLAEVFGLFHSRWIDLRASDWPDYRRDLPPTVDTLVHHLESELRAIRQLLMISDFYAA